MNSQYFWLIDQVNLSVYQIVWAPGLGNLANYFTKHFLAAHHCAVRLYYVHMPNSPRIIMKIIQIINYDYSIIHQDYPIIRSSDDPIIR